MISLFDTSLFRHIASSVRPLATHFQTASMLPTSSLPIPPLMPSLLSTSPLPKLLLLTLLVLPPSLTILGKPSIEEGGVLSPESLPIVCLPLQRQTLLMGQKLLVKQGLQQLNPMTQNQPQKLQSILVLLIRIRTTSLLPLLALFLLKMFQVAATLIPLHRPLWSESITILVCPLLYKSVILLLCKIFNLLPKRTKLRDLSPQF